MSVTTQGVYLVTEEDEFFLGRVMDILQKSPREPWGQGISLTALLMDIVQDIVDNPTENSKEFTIEIRE